MKNIDITLKLHIEGANDRVEEVGIGNDWRQPECVMVGWFCEATCKHVSFCVADLDEEEFDLEEAKAEIVREAKRRNRYADFIYVD